MSEAGVKCYWYLSQVPQEVWCILNIEKSSMLNIEKSFVALTRANAWKGSMSSIYKATFQSHDSTRLLIGET